MKVSSWTTTIDLVCVTCLAIHVGACGFARISEVHGITTTCCESLGDDDCSSGFPATCGSACADVLVPFWEECGSFMLGLSSASYNFDISSFGTFAGVCRNARSLVHFANGECSSDAASLQARAEDIQQSCCVRLLLILDLDLISSRMLSPFNQSRLRWLRSSNRIPENVI